MSDAKLSAFWATFDGDKDTAIEVSEMFCGYSVELFSNIEQAITQGDVDATLLHLHSLKGTLAYLGFGDETDEARALEQQINNDGLSSLTQGYAAFKGNVEKLVELLKTHVLTK